MALYLVKDEGLRQPGERVNEIADLQSFVP
jgi:hypothetical protein